MGAGGSVPDETTAAIAAEAGKPADASDCATTEAAVEEVKRLRALLAQHKSATTGAAASPAKTAADYDPDRFKGLSLDADAEIGTPAHPKLASTKSRRFLTRMASGDVSGAVAEITSTEEKGDYFLLTPSMRVTKRRNSLIELRDTLNMFKSSQLEVKNSVADLKAEIKVVEGATQELQDRMSWTDLILTQARKRSQKLLAGPVDKLRRMTFIDGESDKAKWGKLKHHSMEIFHRCRKDKHKEAVQQTRDFLERRSDGEVSPAAKAKKTAAAGAAAAPAAEAEEATAAGPKVAAVADAEAESPTKYGEPVHAFSPGKDVDADASIAEAVAEAAPAPVEAEAEAAPVEAETEAAPAAET